MKIVNLTPHALRFRRNEANPHPEPDTDDLVIQPRRGADGKVWAARVGTTPGGPDGTIECIRVFNRTIFGVVEGLPGPVEDTIYVVSAMVAGRPEVTNRNDVFYPGTGPDDKTIRTAEGQIFAVTRLVRA